MSSIRFFSSMGREKEYGRISEKKYTEVVDEIGLLLEKEGEDRASS